MSRPNSTPVDWSDHISRLEAYHDLVKRFLSNASSRQAKYYNKGRRKVRYKIGQLVMKREHYLSSAVKHFSGKLASLFSGPYRISEIISPTVYELQLQCGRIIPKEHVRFLKTFSFSQTSSVDSQCLAIHYKYESLTSDMNLELCTRGPGEPAFYVGMKEEPTATSS